MVDSYRPLYKSCCSVLNSAAGMDGEEVGLGGSMLWCISKTLWKVLLYCHIKVLLFELSISGIFSHGIYRIRKLVAITLNTKFDFISLIGYSFVDLICFRMVKMQKVFLMIILMINGPYVFYLLTGNDPSQCLVVLSDAV